MLRTCIIDAQKAMSNTKRLSTARKIARYGLPASLGVIAIGAIPESWFGMPNWLAISCAFAGAVGILVSLVAFVVAESGSVEAA